MTLISSGYLAADLPLMIPASETHSFSKFKNSHKKLSNRFIVSDTMLDSRVYLWFDLSAFKSPDEISAANILLQVAKVHKSGTIKIWSASEKWEHGDRVPQTDVFYSEFEVKKKMDDDLKVDLIYSLFDSSLRTARFFVLTHLSQIKHKLPYDIKTLN